eukprot:TRINITY_DN401_c6_g1_i4.p1 TRINITY_DN401_c6_g1~~TRINITY_DN401_c6_g1_i4.p1  ORF type:complete len:583 (+),score=95.76 TRINITY_DN401_c6_g1_i4:73-1821(+)
MMGPSRTKTGSRNKGYSKPTAASTSREVVRSGYDGVPYPATQREVYELRSEPVYKRHHESSGQDILDEMLDRHAADQWMSRKREFDKDRLLDELLTRGVGRDNGYGGGYGHGPREVMPQYHYVSSGSVYNEEMYRHHHHHHHHHHHDHRYPHDREYIEREMPHSHVSQVSESSYRSTASRVVPAPAHAAPSPPPVMTRKSSRLSSSFRSSGSVSRQNSDESVVKSGGSLSPNRDDNEKSAANKRGGSRKHRSVPEVAVVTSDDDDEVYSRRSRKTGSGSPSSRRSHSEGRRRNRKGDDDDERNKSKRSAGGVLMMGGVAVHGSDKAGSPKASRRHMDDSDSSSYEEIIVRRKKPKAASVSRRSSKETLNSVGVSGTTVSMTDSEGDDDDALMAHQRSMRKAAQRDVVEVPKDGKKSNYRGDGESDEDGVIIPALKGSRPVLTHNGPMLDADAINNASYSVLAREIFKRYDRDQDGVLSKFEYTLLMMDIAYDLHASDNFTTGITQTRLNGSMTPSRASAFRRLLLAPPIGSFVTIEGCVKKAKINGLRGKVRSVRRDGMVELNLAGGVKQYLTPANLIWEDN